MNPNEDDEQASIVNTLATHVGLAANVAREAPEEFRQLTFDRVLTKLLADGAPKPSPRVPISVPNQTRSGHSSADMPLPAIDGDPELQRMLDVQPQTLEKYSHVWRLKNKLEVMYAIIRYARDECQMDGITEAQIRVLAAKLFRVNLKRGTVSGNLAMAPPNELLRQNGEGKMRFRLMRAGDDRLAKAIKELDD